MKQVASKLVPFAFALGMIAPGTAHAQDTHPLMSSKYWVNVGAYFAARDFKASADGTVSGDNNDLDFEREFALDDGPDLMIAEFGWQFGEKWGIGLQYFQSERDGQRTLERTLEWQDVTYEAGVSLRAETDLKIGRVVLSRNFWDGGNHSLRVSGGFHWLEIGASLAGEATLEDMSTGFRRESVSASAPIPNIGAWYRYSVSERWLLSARVDWLSASVDDYSGGIWNVNVGANLSFSDHFGAGLAYQFFELDGSVKNSDWRGDIKSSFSGPHLYLSAYW